MFGGVIGSSEIGYKPCTGTSGVCLALLLSLSAAAWGRAAQAQCTGSSPGENQEESLEESTIRITWLGQAGFAIETPAGKTAMVDPYLSHSMKGVTYLHPAPAVAPDSARADVVFCTHDHIDHADVPTLSAIARTNPAALIYGPTSVIEHLRAAGFDSLRLRRLDRGQVAAIGADLTVKAVHAQHTGDSEGLILNFGGIVIYHTGDTEVGLAGYIDRMHDVKDLDPDVMLVCINTGYRNLGPEDAAKLVSWVSPGVVIPMHYDLIAENTIDPEAFLRILGSEHLASKPVLMGYGETYTYRKKE